MEEGKPFWTSMFIFTTANLIQSSWFLSHPFMYIIWVWIITAVCFAIPFALLSMLVVRSNLKSMISTAGFAALFSCLEWSYTQVLCGYPFQLAAIHLSWSLPCLQVVSYFGAIGLSFFVFWANLLSYSWLRRKGSFVAMIVVASIPYILGMATLHYQRSLQDSFDATTAHKTIGIIHMEEPPDVFSASLAPDLLVTREWKKIFPSLSSIPPRSVDFVVLPEGAIPYAATSLLFPSSQLPTSWQEPTISSYISTLDVCTAAANFLQAPILIGLEGRSVEKGFSKPFNSCFFVPPGQPIERYDKQLLLPLGEYIPCVSLRSYLASYGIHGSFYPGEGPAIFDKNNLRISPFICYEEVFSDYTLAANTLHPKLLVSVSNDCWFPNPRFAREHFELARIRAVEIGKPLVRSCNEGKSGAIDALGRVVIENSQRENACLIASLSQYTHSTLFSNIGQVTVVLTLLIFGVIVILLQNRQQIK
jgi:apolipoprotein N-acyltransferase